MNNNDHDTEAERLRLQKRGKRAPSTDGQLDLEHAAVLEELMKRPLRGTS